MEGVRWRYETAKDGSGKYYQLTLPGLLRQVSADVVMIALSYQQKQSAMALHLLMKRLLLLDWQRQLTKPLL